MRRIRPGRYAALALLAALAQTATGVHAESDAQVYENAIERTARLCPGHSVERSTPGVKAIQVGALRVLAKRDVTLCPDRRLDAATPVAWYGRASVYAWNPEATGAVAVLATRVDAMTRKEDFRSRRWCGTPTAAKPRASPCPRWNCGRARPRRTERRSFEHVRRQRLQGSKPSAKRRSRPPLRCSAQPLRMTMLDGHAPVP